MQTSATRQTDPFNLNERNNKLSDQEFSALPRVANGDLSTDFDFHMAMIWKTPKQVDRLSGDNQSRYWDLQEELDYMASAYL